MRVFLYALALQRPLQSPRLVLRSDGLTMQLPGIGNNMADGFEDFKRKFGMGTEPDTGLTQEESKEMEGRMKAGEMSFDDFLKQVQVMQKAGSMQAMMSKVPGMGGNALNAEQLAEGEKKLQRYSEYVKVMEADERADPKLLIAEAELMRGNGAPGERIARIAQASASEPSQVALFVNEFSSLRTAALKFSRGENPETIRKEMMEEQKQVKPVNRAQRRQAKRKKTGAVRAKGGFGPGR